MGINDDADGKCLRKSNGVLAQRLQQGRMGKFRWKGIYQFSYNSDNLGKDSCHTMVAIF